jgi:multicomponent Na+:H+ antiporter subunit G
MADIQQITGAALIAIGAFFYLVGAIGIYRMPDVFTRMHAASVSETLGVGLLLIGMMFLAGLSLVSVKLAIILGIIYFTSPAATHALAQAALHEGIKPEGVGDEILVGSGAHPGPEKTGRRTEKRKKSPPKRPPKKSVELAAKRKSAGKTSPKRKPSSARRRTRS